MSDHTEEKRNTHTRTPCTVSLVSYNLLSSRLSRADYFTHCDPRHLEAKARYHKILGILKPHVHKGAVVCLQEVSMAWAGSLHAFFHKEGYYMIHSLYGKHFNGYMGIAIAIPIGPAKERAQYDILGVDIARIADEKKWPRPTGEADGNWLVRSVTKGTASLGSWAAWGFRKASCGLWKSKVEQEDPLQHSKRRDNTCIFVRLKCTQSQKVFCVATYHMPCAFYSPPVMVIHAALVAQRVQRLSRSAPYILAGDWNFKPDSSPYKLITTGVLEQSDASYPSIPSYDSWRPALSQAMKSAYVQANGEEPSYTNYAHIKADKEAFKGCLDYIFHSPQFEVTATEDIADATGESFPNEEQPSDHVLIGATLRLK